MWSTIDICNFNSLQPGTRKDLKAAGIQKFRNGTQLLHDRWGDRTGTLQQKLVRNIGEGCQLKIWHVLKERYAVVCFEQGKSLLTHASPFKTTALKQISPQQLGVWAMEELGPDYKSFRTKTDHTHALNPVGRLSFITAMGETFGLSVDKVDGKPKPAVTGLQLAFASFKASN